MMLWSVWESKFLWKRGAARAALLLFYSRPPLRLGRKAQLRSEARARRLGSEPVAGLGPHLGCHGHCGGCAAVIESSSVRRRERRAWTRQARGRRQPPGPAVGRRAAGPECLRGAWHLRVNLARLPFACASRLRMPVQRVTVRRRCGGFRRPWPGSRPLSLVGPGPVRQRYQRLEVGARCVAAALRPRQKLGQECPPESQELSPTTTSTITLPRARLALAPLNNSDGPGGSGLSLVGRVRVRRRVPPRHSADILPRASHA